MATWYEISGDETKVESPDGQTLNDKYREDLYWLRDNCYFGSWFDFTNHDYIVNFSSAYQGLSPAVFYKVSGLVWFPNPPTGKRWKISIRFLGRADFVTRNWTFREINYETGGITDVLISCNPAPEAWRDVVYYKIAAFKSVFQMDQFTGGAIFWEYKYFSIKVESVDV